MDLKELKKLLRKYKTTLIKYKKTLEVNNITPQEKAQINKLLNDIELIEKQIAQNIIGKNDTPNKSRGEIFRVKKSVLKKYKEEAERYLYYNHGIILNWNSDGSPSPNIGQKYNSFGDKTWFIIYSKELEINNKTGGNEFSQVLKRYRQLEAEIQHSNISENKESSLTNESDLEKLKKLRELLENPKGGLDDIYDHIIRDKELKEHYKKIIERIRDDWKEEGRMTQLEEEVKERLEQVLEREQDSPCMDENPEPLPEHEANSSWDEVSQLPLTTLGEGDCEEIALNDIDQGQTGDCYLLSSMGALAKSNPKLFDGESEDSVIKKEGENYVVTFYPRLDRNTDKRTKVEITVTPEILTDASGRPIYQGQADGELWAIIIEKAYAQMLGGYDNIEGGTPSEALATITGKEAKTIDPKFYKNEDLITRLFEALDKNQPVTFSSSGNDENPIQILLPNTANTTQTLFEGHAYTLDRVQNDSIFLYNPHGQKHLEITPSQVKTFFSHITIQE